MGVQLKVDGKVIPINEFVENILNGTVTGAVTTLKGVPENWEKRYPNGTVAIRLTPL